jgi:sugar/nucleoside kinase (ribokinase family)
VQWGGNARASAYYMQGGGLTATALVACARLGARCEVFSLLGDDHTGDAVIAGLRDEGVDTSGVARTAGGQSPVSFIHVDQETGDRTIFHHAGSGLVGAALPDVGAIAQYDALLIDNYYLDLAIAAAKIARDHSVPVVADVTTSFKAFELLRYVDVLITPEEFAGNLGKAGDVAGALKAIHELGPDTAILTRGAEGYVYSSPDSRGIGKAFKVDVVDTTGAGDAFHGGFAYGIARGWDTARSAEFAAAVAAIKCTKEGGRTGLPSLAQTHEFLREKGSLDWFQV